MSTSTTTPTLAELRAQLREIADDRTAAARRWAPPSNDAPVADRMAAFAEYAERRAAWCERERDLWEEVLTATYQREQPDDDSVLLLREAVLTLSGHVAVEALEARRYADSTASTAQHAAERRAEQAGGVR